MNRLTISALSGCGAAMLLGCATPSPQSQPAALGMQPVLLLQSGGEQRATYWYQLGKYHQGRGELNLAMGAYAQSLALDGRQLDARMAVAAIDARQGRLAAARDALQTLVADYPAQAQLSNNLGYVYYLMGDQQAAVAMLRRALVLDAASVKAQDNLRLAEAAALAGAPSAMLAGSDADLQPPSRAEMQQVQHQLRQLQERSAAAGLAPLPVVAVPDAAPAAPAAASPAAFAGAVPASVLSAVSAPAFAPVPPVLAQAPVDIANGDGLLGLAERSGRALADTEAEVPPPTYAEMQQLQQQLSQLQERSAAAGLAPRHVAAGPAAAPIVLAAAPAAPASASPAAFAGAVPASILAAVSPPAKAPVRPVLAQAPVDIANGNGLSGQAKRFRHTLADTEAELPPPTRAEMQQLQQQLRQLLKRSVAASPAASASAFPARAMAAVSAPAIAPGRPLLAQAPVDIANGNGLLGLAKRFRRTLAQLGIPVGRLSNERPYRQQTTTIEYRPGYQQQALALQAALRGQAALMEASPQATAGVRLVLGKDSSVEPVPTAGARLVTSASASAIASAIASAKVN